MTATWRLFLGLWPPPGVRAAIEHVSTQWRWPAAARRTAPDRLHITLHFLGDVAVEQVPVLVEALRPLQWKGCTLELDRVEVWPGGIAVLEAGKVPPPLRQLHADLATVLAQLALPVESRRYRPHVTLARKAQGARPPVQPAAIGWPVAGGFMLLRSLPGGGGYLPVQAFG